MVSAHTISGPDELRKEMKLEKPEALNREHEVAHLRYAPA
jgi:hypothetical protein